jgi:glucose-1-phosphatase
MQAKTSAVVFDLGNVVVRVDFSLALQAWGAHSRLQPEALRAAFRLDDAYHRHENGALAPQDYFAHLRTTLALDCDLDAVRAGWNGIFPGAIDSTLVLIDQLRASGLPCYALSNTNATHEQELRRAFPGMLERFDHVFTSHGIGHRKPHPQAFRYVEGALALPPGDLLFFDDLQENVDAATACGWQAVLVKDPGDVKRGLAARGLVAG